MTDPLTTAGCLPPSARSPLPTARRKFILIDHSITDTGGHHLEYAVRVLQSAERQGYEPVLATNRKLRGGEQLPWRVLPVYRYGFWFQTAPPRIVAVAQRARQAMQRRAFLRDCRWHFSTWGILWSHRHAPREVLGEAPTARQMVAAAAVVATVIYPVMVARSLGRLLAAALPIGGYLRSVRRAALDVLTTITWPVRAGIKRWPAISRRAFAWRKQAAFAADTLRLFRSVKLAEGDVVFIPTLAEPEMLGLLKLFEREPLSAAATWHLLFRRDIYVGRDPDYPNQDERQRPLRSSFQRFLAGLSGQRVHFYTDTERLTDQYNRLGVATFHTAPIPVAADYRPACLEDVVPTPSRRTVGWAPPTNTNDHGGQCPPYDALAHVVYLGDARTEKGYRYLPHLVADLAVDGPPARFTFQSNFNVPGGEPAPAVARAQLAAFPEDQVRLVTLPMSGDEYRRLLLDADVVLIPYDRDNYYARSSGVFAEALVAGKPVVVPAGTWMATELAPAIAAWHRTVREQCRVVASFGRGRVRWRTRENSRLRTVPDAPLPVYGQSPSYCCLAAPAGATHLLVTFRLSSSGGGHGIFPGIVVQQFDRGRHCLKRDVAIVSGADECSALVQVTSGARRLRVEISNAFSPLPLAVSEPRIDFLGAADALPLSAVGVIYAEPVELARQVREMLLHGEHYHATALAFSHGWADYHSAERLVAQLAAHDAAPGGMTAKRLAA